MTGYGLLWALWVGVLAVSFTYLEARAIHDPKTSDTLTENVRAWFHTREHNGRGRLGRVLFLALFTAFPAWWLLHILAPGFV